MDINLTNSLLERLQKGEDIEAIASDLTKSLNAANSRYEAEIREKKKQEELKTGVKREAVKEFLAAINKVVEAWGLTALGNDFRFEIDDESINDYINQFDLLASMCKKIYLTEDKPPEKRDAVQDFLDKFVR